MSIFGKLDAATIPTNPYFVEKGEYEAEITGAEFKQNNKGQNQLIIAYTIDDESSQFFDSKINQYFVLPDADLDNEKMALLPADEQKSIRKTISAMKRTLCGDSRNKGLGVDEDDLNDEDWTPEVLKGLKVNISVYNFGTDGTGIQWANLRD